MTALARLPMNGVALPDRPASGPLLPAGNPIVTRDLYRFMSVQLFCVIYLQKLAIPVPGIPPLSIPLIVMIVSLGELIRRGQLRVSPLCLCLFGSLVAAVAVSQLFVSGPISFPSLILLLVFSGQFAVFWEVDLALYRAMLSLFLRFMILPALMVFVQLGWQGVNGLGHTLSVEPLVPHFLLLPGYLYEAPIHYGAKFVRPNGFFMLEPSYISALLGMAVLVEAMYFRRPWRLLLFFAALVGTVAATGMVMLAVAGPFLLARQSRRFLQGFAVVGVLALAVAWPLGVGERMIDRLDELNSQHSSGGERLVLPARQLAAVLDNPAQLVTGLGAGQLDESSGSAWPMVKVAREYGLVAMVLYMTLFVAALGRCPNLPLKIGVFVLFHLTGGYLLNPVIVETVLLLCTLLNPARSSLAVGFGFDGPGGPGFGFGSLGFGSAGRWRDMRG